MLVLVLGLTLLDAGVARASPGDLDPSFGAAGVVNLTSAPYGVADIATTADGSVIVVGSNALLKLAPDGTVDSGFGGDGNGYVPATPRALAIGPDGSIYVATYSIDHLGVYTDGGLTKYTPDGLVDQSYGNDGTVEVSPDYELSVDVDSQGRAVLGNWNGVKRFLADGSLDDSFEPDESVSDDVRAVLHDSQGRLLVATMGSGGDTYRVTRLEANGSLDTSFGMGGSVVVAGSRIPLPARDDVDLALDSQGRLLVGTEVGPTPDDHSGRAYRFLPSGDPDPSFSPATVTGGGWLVADNSDGVLSTGDSSRFFPYELPTAEIRRLRPDGTPDSSFGLGGLTALRPGATSVFARDIDRGPGATAYLLLTEESPRFFRDRLSFVARVRLDPGDDDVDADSFEDSQDRCPRVADASNGCPELGRRFTEVAAVGRRLRGTVEARAASCRRDVPVAIYRKPPGESRKFVQKTKTDDANNSAWHSRRLRPGRYFAIARAGDFKGMGHCRAARSDVVGLKGD